MSSELDDARQVIDQVDHEMARLFTARMQAAARIASYKRDHGLPVYDAAREAQVIQQGARLVSDDLQPYFKRFQESVMQLSREYQQRHMQ